MGEYIDIGGVKTWYDTAGRGAPLVLLHGGMVTNDTWSAQIPAFASSFHVFAPERRGHGHTPDVEGPLNYSDMADDMIGFIETVVNGPTHVVGWSDGGILALMIAAQRPDLIRKLVVIGGITTREDAVPGARAILDLSADDPALAMFRGQYAAHSPDGPEHFAVVFAKFVEMAEGNTQPDIKAEELASIAARTLVISGDDDIMPLEHTIRIYRSIPNSELAVLPGTSHALVFEKPELLNRVILDFLENDAVPTMMPFRRAAS